jgi:hypothetical protein
MTTIFLILRGVKNSFCFITLKIILYLGVQGTIENRMELSLNSMIERLEFEGFNDKKGAQTQERFVSTRLRNIKSRGFANGRG